MFRNLIIFLRCIYIASAISTSLTPYKYRHPPNLFEHHTHKHSLTAASPPPVRRLKPVGARRRRRSCRRKQPPSPEIPSASCRPFCSVNRSCSFSWILFQSYSYVTYKKAQRNQCEYT
uniref:Secreted protein n=1 Tax=Helianthus annuus TaxID=4232 RepID=A0A251VNF2_HELAN